MRTQKQIETGISQLFFSWQSKITTYAKGSSVRALIVAVSAFIFDLWNEVTQIKRKLFPSTAIGTDLDDLLSEHGTKRLEQVSLSTILVFGSNEIVKSNSTSVGLNYLTDTTQYWDINEHTGKILYDSSTNEYTIVSNTSNTLVISGTPASGLYYIFPVVPVGTAILSNISGVKYLTTSEVIVGKSNPVLLARTNSIALGNRTIATCEQAGDEGRVQANELTVFETEIPGVSSVTNPLPSQPRSSVDSESDDAFRQRTAMLISSYDIGTQAFFESLAVRGNNKVLRSIAKKNILTDGVQIHIATRSGEGLSAGELTALATYIYDRSRAFDTVDCVNMVMTDIFVDLECALPPDITLEDYYNQVANALADYFDYSKWNTDDSIIDDDLLVIIKAIDTDVDIDLSTFMVEASKNSVFFDSKRIELIDSLPRFARLRIKDTILDETLDYVLNSYPISQQNDPLLNPYAFQ